MNASSSEKIRQQLTNIKLLILDVDGVLTDGSVIITNHEDEAKNFDVKDGLGLVLLQQAGIKVAIITGKSSKIVDRRLTALGVKDIFQGQKNKLYAFAQLKQKHILQNHQIAYIGDDLPDLPLLKTVGFSAAPKDAYQFVIEHVDYIAKHNGGRGAVREISDLILDAQGLLTKVTNDYIAFGEAKFGCF